LSNFRAKDLDEKIAKAKEVATRLIGDLDHGVEPQNITEIQKAMNYRKNTMIYKYKELAIEKGFLSLDDQGDPILPKKTESEKWRLYSKKHELALNPLMVRYLKKQAGKEGGEGVGKTRVNFNVLVRFFNTLRITPEELVADHSESKVEAWRDEYIARYIAGTDYNPSNRKRGTSKGQTLLINYALASFCAGHGLTWIRGDEVMNRRVVGHAKYAGIRLSKAELLRSDNYLKEKYGIDSNIYRWFWGGIETSGRDGASKEGSGLYGMKLQWDELESVTKKGEKRTTFFMQMYESKTKKIRDGIWDKWVKRPDTQESFRALKKRGGTRIWESDLTKSKFIDQMNDQLKDLYKFLGKDPDSLFFKRPSHVLRHLSAHYWLSKGNYKNHVEVAKLGGWNTVDEMIKSYGEFPPEKMNEFLDEYDYY